MHITDIYAPDSDLLAAWRETNDAGRGYAPGTPVSDIRVEYATLEGLAVATRQGNGETIIVVICDSHGPWACDVGVVGDMTPAEAWDAFVGEQTAQEFAEGLDADALDAEVLAYAAHVRSLGTERPVEYIAAKLRAYIDFAL